MWLSINILVNFFTIIYAIHHFEEECRERKLSSLDVNNCILSSEANVHLRILKRDITVGTLYPRLYLTLPIEHCNLSACVPGSAQGCEYVCPDDPNNELIEEATLEHEITESTTSTTSEINIPPSVEPSAKPDIVNSSNVTQNTDMPSSGIPANVTTPSGTPDNATQPMVTTSVANDSSATTDNNTLTRNMKRSIMVNGVLEKRSTDLKSEIQERYLWSCDFPRRGCCRSCRRLVPIFLRIKSGRGWVYPVFCVKEGGYQLTDQLVCLKNGCTKKCARMKVFTKVLVTNEPPNGWDGHCGKRSLAVWFKTIETDSHCNCPAGGNPWSMPSNR